VEETGREDEEPARGRGPEGMKGEGGRGRREGKKRGGGGQSLFSQSRKEGQTASSFSPFYVPVYIGVEGDAGRGTLVGLENTEKSLVLQ
jgi:hypothetical protein